MGIKSEQRSGKVSFDLEMFEWVLKCEEELPVHFGSEEKRYVFRRN